MRQDKKRRAQNKLKKQKVKAALRKAKEKPIKENLSLAYSLLDKAAKTHLFHKNKVARLKSQLAKLIKRKEKIKKVVKKPLKKSSPKPRKKSQPSS